MKSAYEYNVAVVGPGAVGSLVAARLARAGFRVLLLDHCPRRAAQLACSGIAVEDEDGSWTAHPTVVSDPATAAQADCIIVCVKANSTETLCRQLEPHVCPGSTILSLQNGLGNLEQLMRLKARVVLAGVTGMGALLVAAGRVQATGGGVTWIAPARGPDRAAGATIATLRTAGFDVHLHPDLRSMLWTKLILNAAINPLTALYHLRNGELLAHPQGGILAKQVVLETVTVANAAGIPLCATELLVELEALCQRTAANRSSMLRDVEQGRPTEVHAITGAIVDQAVALGINVPISRQILAHFSGK